MNEEKMRMITAIKMNFRGLKIYCKYSPKTLISLALHDILTTLNPFVAIFISARLINALASGESAGYVWTWVIISLVSAAVLGLLTAVVTRWKNVHNSEDLWFCLNDIYRTKRLSMDFCVSDSQKVRDLRSKIQQDINWGGWGILYVKFIFSPLIKAVTSLIISGVLCVNLFISSTVNDSFLFLNSPIALLVLIVVIIIVTIISPILSVTANNQYISLSEEIKFANRFFSFFNGKAQDKKRALDMRIYNQQIICCEYVKVNNMFAKGKSFDRKNKGTIGILKAIAAAISTALTGVIYLFVCLKALGGAFAIGFVAQYIASVTKFVSSLGVLLQAFALMKPNAEFLKTAFEYLDTPNVMYRGSLTTEKRSDKKYEVEFKNVSFKYPDTENFVLKNVSLKFKVGEKLAIVGENGSGKTTFIKLLCRLYEPTEGRILLNGIDISKYNYDDYLTIFSVVFQDFKLLAHTVAQNVAASKKYDENMVEECLIKAGFGERLKTLPKGIQTNIYKDLEKDGVEVSGGEAQKIALARAIYKQAPFVILDEPTAALDPIAEAEIYSKFNEIVGERTAVYISHRLSSCKFCDEIAVFENGEIAECGKHDELLLKNGKYSKLWNAQAQYYAQENAESA